MLTLQDMLGLWSGQDKMIYLPVSILIFLVISTAIAVYLDSYSSRHSRGSSCQAWFFS